jgi:hypothetical protein
MSFKRSRILLITSLLISLTLACALTGSAEKPVADLEDAVATAVAATLAAGQADTPPTVQPSVTASPPEPDIVYQGISFAFDDSLSDNVTAGMESEFNEESNPWWSTPEHRMFIFNNWSLGESFLPAQLKVYPVAELRAINPGVGESLDSLQAVITSQPADGGDVVVTDIFNAGQMFLSKVAYLQFQNGRGVRFLTQYGQAISPIGWPMMFYSFQGFTDDGVYYISAMLPVTHPSLPHPDDITLDEAFMNNFETYRDELEIQLNGEQDSTFMPSLILLDEFVESLLVGE